MPISTWTDRKPLLQVSYASSVLHLYCLPVNAATTCAAVRSGSVSSGPDELLLAAGVPEVLVLADVLGLPSDSGLSPEQDVVPTTSAAQARTAAPYRGFRPAPRSPRRGRS
ncbi:hypothetical protein [Kribbella soli]|uniref:hypothetical protein n=1 Tax=Kribbella soli TaxID=1124743 RepID=UPI001EDEE309|nr:hypothetical protein [Kribbella soli]